MCCREKQVWGVVLAGAEEGMVLCIRICFGGWVGRRRRVLFIVPCMGMMVEVFKKLIIHFSFAHN